MVGRRVHREGTEGKISQYLKLDFILMLPIKLCKASVNKCKFNLQRGGVLIQKWGRSSAASTAVSIVDAIKSLITPTPEGDWFSSGVSSFLLNTPKFLFQKSDHLMTRKSID